MELVYLWVEDYKNIHRQGFNFSPRFTCDYDPDTNELTIDENDEYIKDFFGDNINVTAIVGKNGSGKSSVLRAIKDFNSYHHQDEDFNFIVCMEVNSKITAISSIQDITCTHEVTHIQKEKFIEYESDIEKSIEIYNCYLFSIMAEDGFDSYSKEVSDLAIKNSKENFTFELTTFMRYPKKISFYDNEEHRDKLIIDIQPPIAVYSNNPENGADFPPCYHELIDLNTDNSLEAYMINKIVKEDMCYDLFKVYDVEDTNNSRINRAKVLQNFYDEYEFNEEGYNLYEYSRLIEKATIDLTDGMSDDTKMLIEKYKDFLFFDFEDDRERKFSDLSHGEKSIYAQFIMMHDVAKNNNQILFTLDEPDLSLHPEWQRRYIYEFMNSFSNMNKDIHLVVTSHSPFLLSDIPKQNIIFLDTDENGNCKVVDGLKEKKQTFGANIHTLLSDSFFMEDGLMGEFAKSKINEIITFHEETEKEDANIDALTSEYQSKKDKFWQTQSIVGDEYLKQVLKNHLIEIEKILLGKDRAKENEIKRTEAYLESLKHG